MQAVTALKMFSYHIAMKKEEGQFYYNINNEVKLATLETLKERIAFLENILKKQNHLIQVNLKNHLKKKI